MLVGARENQVINLWPRVVRILAVLAAAILLMYSIRFPYWSLVLHAPQYPNGLTITSYSTHMTGDVEEIDELNHYIGMMKLDDAAKLERSAVPYLFPAMAALALLSLAFRRFGAWLFSLPILFFPVIFFIDLWAWLSYAGHHLDPQAPLSSTIKPFSPTALGTGKIGQFATTASFGSGFYLALTASLLVLAALALVPRKSSAQGR